MMYDGRLVILSPFQQYFMMESCVQQTLLKVKNILFSVGNETGTPRALWQARFKNFKLGRPLTFVGSSLGRRTYEKFNKFCLCTVICFFFFKISHFIGFCQIFFLIIISIIFGFGGVRGTAEQGKNGN